MSNKTNKTLFPHESIRVCKCVYNSRSHSVMQLLRVKKLGQSTTLGLALKKALRKHTYTRNQRIFVVAVFYLAE